MEVGFLQSSRLYSDDHMEHRSKQLVSSSLTILQKIQNYICFFALKAFHEVAAKALLYLIALSFCTFSCIINLPPTVIMVDSFPVRMDGS